MYEQICRENQNLHHGHGDLLEIVFVVLHVGDRLRAEYDREPRAQLVLQKFEAKFSIIITRNNEKRTGESIEEEIEIGIGVGRIP